MTQVSTTPLRGASAHREAVLRALSIAGVVCLAVEFVYTVIDTVAVLSFIHTYGHVVGPVSLFLGLRILFGPVLFTILTMCGVFAQRLTAKRIPSRNLFAVIFVAIGAVLLLERPPLVGVTPGAHYVWGNATLHVFSNILILVAAAIYLGATLLTQVRAIGT